MSLLACMYINQVCACYLQRLKLDIRSLCLSLALAHKLPLESEVTVYCDIILFYFIINWLKLNKQIFSAILFSPTHSNKLYEHLLYKAFVVSSGPCV